MLSMDEFDQLRPYVDANFEGASAHHIEKLDADLRGAAGPGLDPVPPFTAESARTAANRRNAEKTTGQKTEAGKAATSQNRLAHGLCSEELLIGGETSADFEALLGSVRRAYNPLNDEEAMLTDHLVQALWRFNRAQRVETTMLQSTQMLRLVASNAHGNTDVEFADMDPIDGDSMLTVAFTTDLDYKHIERITRYMTTMERSYQRTLKVLQHAQEKRRNLPRPAVEIAQVAELAPPTKPEKAAAATSPIQCPFYEPAEYGFEPQNQAPSFVSRC